jgi:hypothetical protein
LAARQLTGRLSLARNAQHLTPWQPEFKTSANQNAIQESLGTTNDICASLIVEAVASFGIARHVLELPAMPLRTDDAAKEIALRRWVLPACLHVPIAAVDEFAIRDYIGDIEQIMSGSSAAKAFLVKVPEAPIIDPLLPICDHPNASILHARRQVWVHVGFNRYRDAYRKAFPNETIAGKVLSHTMNRRTAALKGFDYVRITPASRGGNSSSGFSEQWGVSLHGSPAQIAARRIRPPFIQYADLSDLMLMLDIKVGGGVMDVVNEGQKLVERRTTGL